MLTEFDFNELCELIYRKRSARPEYPKQCLDLDKIIKHRIRVAIDQYTGQWITSGSEMRRAKALGAIWYEDENGKRLESPGTTQ